MEWKNDLTALLKIDYPIVQAPMLGVTTPEMVAAIANEGGLGSLPVGGLSPEKTAALIRETKALTDKPFAVNLFTNNNVAPDIAQTDAMQDLLEKLCADYKVPFERQDVAAFRFYSYKEQIQVLLDEQIPVVSFTFGVLDPESTRVLKEKGFVLIGTATSVEEAVLLEQKEVDIITAQGIEAGGHRGTFLEDGPMPQVGLMSLVPQIVNSVDIPVLAAGGINSGNTIQAAFLLGAKGVQVGTAFIASNESKAIAAYKAALTYAADTDTALTKAFSGRWARGIRNTLMMAIEQSGLEIPAYPVQNFLTTTLRAAAQKTNNKEFTNLWAGQSAASAEALPSKDIFRKLVSETEALK